MSVKKTVKHFDFISLGIFILAFYLAIYIYELQDANEEMEIIIDRQNELLNTQRKYIMEVDRIFNQIDATMREPSRYDNNSPLNYGPL